MLIQTNNEKRTNSISVVTRHALTRPAIVQVMIQVVVNSHLVATGIISRKVATIKVNKGWVILVLYLL